MDFESKYIKRYGACLRLISSGENLSTGGILSVNLQKVGSANDSPTRAYINCLYDAVAELKDSGCFVYS